MSMTMVMLSFRDILYITFGPVFMYTYWESKFTEKCSVLRRPRRYGELVTKRDVQVM